MNYLIIYDTVDDHAFLKENLELHSYRDLVVGKRTYFDLLSAKLKLFSRTKIFISTTPLENFNQLFDFFHRQIVLMRMVEPDANIIYYDLVHYPIDLDSVNTVFEKLQNSDSLVCFTANSKNGKANPLGIYTIPYTKLIANQSMASPIIHSNDSITIDGSHFFINLSKPNDVLSLFASNFQIRSFNTLDQSSYYFIKKSAKKEKMRAEHTFLSHIPEPLRPFFPQVGYFKEKSDTASYEIEKVYLSDFSKLLISNVLTPKLCKKFFTVISDYLELCPKIIVSTQEYQNTIERCFISKTEQRLKELELIPDKGLLDTVCQINGFSSVSALGQTIVDAMRSVRYKVKQHTLAYSHGDLCFSNILFSPKMGIMKLIDPKGFIKEDRETYLPKFYDLAKLSHSAVGLYDLIIYDLQETSFSEQGTIKNVFKFSNETIRFMREAFLEFLEIQEIDFSLVRLYEASLFISMLVLHNDSKRRMVGQLVCAMNSFNEYLELTQ